MLIHIILIFAMNNITTALEFMADEEIRLLPKLLFLMGSLLLFFAFLFAACRYARTCCRDRGRLYGKVGLMVLVFVGLMLLLRMQMLLNIAVTVLFVFGVFLVLYDYGRRVEAIAERE